ncbi:hypothetical protein B0H15DRAFT_831478 [Mycena belliarum]|uniref:F-box domain-containing protein n=1 Tax=Mycena belliarum TaxID=1033014 RepID=A0AAD6XWY0_9AGAR|nr:hypothetical protein B0H15DRAFT_831478 [Mycena belliae]
MLSAFRWLSSWADPVPPTRVNCDSSLYDLPNEIWTQIFQDPLFCKRDLVAVFTSCHHFNQLVLPIVLFNAGTTPSELAAGDVSIPSDIVPILNMAVRLPPLSRISCTFDIRGESRAPRDLKAFQSLAARTPSATNLRLNFLGDLLSAYKSDLVPLAPQRTITEPFCALLSSLPRDPDVPVVFVGTEIFTCRAADIRSWQLDKYIFHDTRPEGGLSGLFRAFSRAPARNSLRTKTSIKQHNGLHTNVFPFISISSLDVKHLTSPFSNGHTAWTLITLNVGMSHWLNTLNLSAPLAATEWAVILPLLAFSKVSLLRMDPRLESTIPTIVLDAFISRHPTLTRMCYYPDPLTLSSALDFPYAALSRVRNITVSAPGALHLFRAPGAFPHLFAVRITGAVAPAALSLLAHHAGHHKLILEVSTGSWMATEDASAATVELHRVDTVVLFGATDFVDADAVLRWVGLFPALRRVGLQGCLHRDVQDDAQRDFTSRARAVLPEHVELIRNLQFF